MLRELEIREVKLRIRAWEHVSIIIVVKSKLRYYHSSISSNPCEIAFIGKIIRLNLCIIYLLNLYTIK